jgi:AcrR family transcriptional regulator
MSFPADIEGRPSVADERRERILDGAFKVFLAYGYTRTTMEDIAKAAEISRPALYLVFRNKTDIYSALATRFLNQLLEGAVSVLAGQGPLAARLDRLSEDVFHCMLREVEESPHGAELLDMKSSLARDVMGPWRQRLDEAMAGAIDAEARANGVDLEARGLSSAVIASMVNDAMEGMKSRIRDPKAHLELGKHYLKVVDALLRP